MNIDEAEYDIEIWASEYNEMKGNYEESIRKRTKLADENERLKYELEKGENTEFCLQAVTRDRDILRMVAKRWEARVENIGTRETLTEKLNRMSKKMDALQEVVNELRAQNERESTRVHELIIERDAGRKIIKEYMEALKELEDENMRLQLALEDERWQQHFRERNTVKRSGMRCVSFLTGICKRNKGEKE